MTHTCDYQLDLAHDLTKSRFVCTACQDEITYQAQEFVLRLADLGREVELRRLALLETRHYREDESVDQLAARLLDHRFQFAQRHGSDY